MINIILHCRDLLQFTHQLCTTFITDGFFLQNIRLADDGVITLVFGNIEVESTANIPICEMRSPSRRKNDRSSGKHRRQQRMTVLKLHHCP